MVCPEVYIVNAAQICRMFDMHPVAIVGSEDKAKFVSENYNLDPSQALFLRSY